MNLTLVPQQRETDTLSAGNMLTVTGQARVRFSWSGGSFTADVNGTRRFGPAQRDLNVSVAGLPGGGGAVVTETEQDPFSALSPDIVRFGNGAYQADLDANLDANAAFTSAITQVKSTRFLISGQSDYSAKSVITFPPGVFLITLPEAMLGLENNTSKITGLKFVGSGRGITQIIFKPASAGVLCQARQWLDIEFSDMTLIAQTADCTMFRTPGTANEQQWTFRRVAFYNWKYIVDPLGTNNCSEVVFDECGNYGMQNDGSWLYIRSAGTSDQFLNYWWTKCKHWSTSAPLIDAAAGGHFHVKQLDFSDWGAGAVVSPATPADGSFLVKLRGNNHSLGVCHASFDVLRGEIKSDSGKLMYSEWGGYGQVSFRDVDLTSQSSVRTYGPAMVYIAFPNANGAKYSFRDSQLAGGVTVEYAINSWQYRNEVTFNDTTWADKNGPSDVVTYVMTGAHGNANPPLVRFQGCGGKNAAYNFTSATAMPVWDATIGLVSIPSVSYQRTVTSMQKRELVLSGVYGNVTSGSTYARLPLGALITDFIVMAPAGGTAEADGGTWTLEADKAGTPATVATVTVAGALSAGFSQGGPLAIPYKCNTAAKCIVAVTPSTVSTAGDAYTIIRGYW